MAENRPPVEPVSTTLERVYLRLIKDSTSKKAFFDALLWYLQIIHSDARSASITEGKLMRYGIPVLTDKAVDSWKELEEVPLAYEEWKNEDHAYLLWKYAGEKEDLFEKSVMADVGHILKENVAHFTEFEPFDLEGCGLCLEKFHHEFIAVLKLAEAMREIEMALKDGKEFTSDLTAGIAWEKISLRLYDTNDAIVIVGGKSYPLSYAQMGLKDNRGKIPNRQWALLMLLAANNGEVEFGKQGVDENVAKKKQLLSEQLRKFFKIDEDPFYDFKKENSYRLKMRIGTWKDRGEDVAGDSDLSEHYRSITPSVAGDK